jgi:hypothetical protein
MFDCLKIEKYVLSHDLKHFNKKHKYPPLCENTVKSYLLVLHHSGTTEIVVTSGAGRDDN